MIKRFDFGKVALNGIKRTNRVYVDVELKEDAQGRPIFTACGQIRNSKNTDCICGGQCLDEISLFVNDSTFNKIRDMWHKHHLNNCHAGTREQETEINRWLAETGERYDYKKVCEHLKEVRLYESVYNNEPYLYGHGWCYEPIPENDLEVIKNLFK